MKAKINSTVLEQQIMYESDLLFLYTVRQFVFNNVFGVPPAEGLCLVLPFKSADTYSAKIWYEDNGGSGRLTTGDAGATWNYDNNKALRYAVYGTWSTPGATQTATRKYVTGVRIGLQASNNAATRTVTAAQTLNRPELLTGLWETDFDTDPTLDHNGDGQADWVDRNDGTFDPASLSGGIWYADTTLDTYPDNNLTALTTAEVRFRNTSVGGYGAVFWINADWSGGLFAPIVACLQLQADGTQTLTVYRKPENPTLARAVSITGFSADFITLRLLIDPNLDTFNVKVDGQEYGTYAYSKFAPPSSDRFATVMPWGSTAQFDYLCVRVGEGL